MSTAYDFGLNVNLSTDEARVVNRALWLMQRANLSPDSSHREKADGSFFTDAEIARLRERFRVTA